MSELRTIVKAARELRARGDAFVSATVVRVRGSAYRRAGARMIATPETWVAGSISGGCLEREVLAKGFWRTREVNAVHVTYNEAEDALDERGGSGCQGVIDMLVERHGGVRASDWFELAEACLRDERAGACVTVFRSGRTGVPVGTRLTLLQDRVASTIDDPALVAELLRKHSAPAARRQAVRGAARRDRSARRASRATPALVRVWRRPRCDSARRIGAAARLVGLGVGRPPSRLYARTAERSAQLSRRAGRRCGGTARSM